MPTRASRCAPTRRSRAFPPRWRARIAFIGGLDDTGMMRKALPPLRHAGATWFAPKSVEAASTSTPDVTPPPVAASNGSPYCNHTFGAGKLVAELSTPADVYGSSIPWLGCGYEPGRGAQCLRPRPGDLQRHGRGRSRSWTPMPRRPSWRDINDYSVNNKLPRIKVGVNFSQIVPAGIYRVSPTEPCGTPTAGGRRNRWTYRRCIAAPPAPRSSTSESRDCGPTLDIAFMDAIYNRVADVITDSWGDNGEGHRPRRPAGLRPRP